MQKTNKYPRGSRLGRAENSLILFHTEVFDAYIVLKRLLLNFIADLLETDRF